MEVLVPNCGIEVEDFKAALDKYLSDIPEEPKVPGMTPSYLSSRLETTNSIVHWSAKMTREVAWRTPGV